MDATQAAYSLVMLRRHALTLSADAHGVATLLQDVHERLESAQGALEVHGSLVSARTLAGGYWSLAHVATALPWLRTDVLVLASALPQVVAGEAAALTDGHPWRDYETTSPLRLREDLFHAQFGC